MKKYVIIALVLVLTLMMVGCRGNTADETAGPSESSATIVPTDMMPNATNGNATDGDGFIDGGTDSTDSSAMEGRRNHGPMPNYR